MIKEINEVVKGIPEERRLSQLHFDPQDAELLVDTIRNAFLVFLCGADVVQFLVVVFGQSGEEEKKQVLPLLHQALFVHPRRERQDFAKMSEHPQEVDHAVLAG